MSESNPEKDVGNIYYDPKNDEKCVVVGYDEFPRSMSVALLVYEDNVEYDMLRENLQRMELVEKASLPIEYTFFNTEGLESAAFSYGVELSSEVFHEVTETNVEQLFKDKVLTDTITAQPLGHFGRPETRPAPVKYSRMVQTLSQAGLPAQTVKEEIWRGYLESIADMKPSVLEHVENTRQPPTR